MQYHFNVLLNDDYTVVDENGFTQGQVNWMLANMIWEAYPAGVGYISVSFYVPDLEQ